MITESFVKKMEEIVGAQYVRSSEADMELYSYDASLIAGKPGLVVFPATTEEVSRVMREAYNAGIPNVGRGFATNLSGGTIIRFEGMVGGETKNRLINGSKALLFPVRWNEPMGLAVVESLYFGCPVFGTPYGALPELVGPEFGFLSNKKSELVEALKHLDEYDRRKCHEYVCDNFASIHMARNFLPLYEKVMNGEPLNPRPPRLVNPDIPKFLPWYDD